MDARKTRTLIVAHRGGAPGEVENSLQAFTFALSSGADIIECDLRRSSDGVVVLFHDAKIDGTPIRSLPFTELRKRIPTLLTLDDLLMFIAGQSRPVRLVLDLKERGLEEALIPILETRPDLVASSLVSTVHAASLRRIARRFPTMRLALSRGHFVSGLPVPLLREGAGRVLRGLYFWWVLPQARWSRARIVALHYRLLDRRIIARYHRAGFRVYAWTVDDPGVAVSLIGAGVNAVASNQPAIMVENLP